MRNNLSRKELIDASFKAQFLNSSGAEEECRLELLNIIDDICTRVTDAEVKQ